IFFFFFQAEDGIRDRNVTGVQTCALPISIGRWRTTDEGGTVIDAKAVFPDGTPIHGVAGLRAFVLQHQDDFVRTFIEKLLTYARSEERRVGKECRSWG